MARGSMTYTPGPSERARHAETSDPDSSKAQTWMIVYGLSLVAAALVGFFAFTQGWREGGLVLLTAFAVASLAFQTMRIEESDLPEGPVWNYTPWFTVAWIVTVASLVSAMAEVLCQLRMVRGPDVD